MGRNNRDETEIFTDAEFEKIIRFIVHAATIFFCLLSIIVMLRAAIFSAL